VPERVALIRPSDAEVLRGVPLRALESLLREPQLTDGSALLVVEEVDGMAHRPMAIPPPARRIATTIVTRTRFCAMDHLLASNDLTLSGSGERVGIARTLAVRRGLQPGDPSQPPNSPDGVLAFALRGTAPRRVHTRVGLDALPGMRASWIHVALLIPGGSV